MIRKICVVTTSRAEYGLLYWLMSLIRDDKELELQIIVSGSHLMDKFGKTSQQIQNDGFKIDEKFEISLDSDKSSDISNAMAESLLGFSKAFKNLKPDIVVLLGDRYEILSAATSALLEGIPLAHIHGGEITEGAFDDAIRHSITKMSHLHFTSTQDYQKRVIQLGENPENVFYVGALGIESINRMVFLSREDLEKSLNIKFDKNNLLITYHPVTLNYDNTGKDIEELFSVLNELENTNLIFTLPNADPGHETIITKINNFAKEKALNRFVFKSLGQKRYLSVLQNVDAVIGNSSSGIIEVPSLKKATINIGDRQKGRISADSVIHCDNDKKSITNALNKIYSDDFQEMLKHVINPYDNGNSSEKILDVLKTVKLTNILRKKFFDIK